MISQNAVLLGILRQLGKGICQLWCGAGGMMLDTSPSEKFELGRPGRSWKTKTCSKEQRKHGKHNSAPSSHPRLLKCVVVALCVDPKQPCPAIDKWFSTPAPFIKLIAMKFHGWFQCQVRKRTVPKAFFTTGSSWSRSVLEAFLALSSLGGTWAHHTWKFDGGHEVSPNISFMHDFQKTSKLIATKGKDPISCSTGRNQAQNGPNVGHTAQMIEAHKLGVRSQMGGISCPATTWQRPGRSRLCAERPQTNN